MKRLLLLLVVLGGSGCAWVTLTQGGQGVRVARADEALSACTYRGEVTTTVTNRVGGLERNSIKVADELETLARNEAATMGADTIRPEGEAVAGEQRFSVYLCGR